ncbi:putative sulfate exporter family transporter [Desulfovirgula thermocuniculi]|uniref:putative sulfate exporter family transporter n=1 Tax=Desulfovirgula thermocuniculi TaxID=348842 RepID=UPI00316AE5FD
MRRSPINRWYSSSIPWFLFGFLGMSCLRTIGLIPEGLVSLLLQMSSLFLTMAMAGMGLSVDMVMFKRMGIKSFLIGLLGSLVISVVGFLAVRVAHF